MDKKTIKQRLKEGHWKCVQILLKEENLLKNQYGHWIIEDAFVHSCPGFRDCLAAIWVLIRLAFSCRKGCHYILIR